MAVDVDFYQPVLQIEQNGPCFQLDSGCFWKQLILTNRCFCIANATHRGSTALVSNLFPDVSGNI